MLLGEALFWTLKDDALVIPSTDYGAFRYSDKKGSFYLEAKKFYSASRSSFESSGHKGGTFKKDCLRELEELTSQQRVVQCCWRNNTVLQMLFSSGLFAYVRVHPLKGDIEKITFDRYLVGKLAAECITDVVCSRESVIVTYSSNVISLVSLLKPSKHPDKLSRQDPRLNTFELAGPSGRRLERKLSLNPEHNMVLVWWRYSQNELYPWSPMTKDCDRANLLVYKISESRLELLCFYKTEADPLMISFSKMHPNRIFLVEQKVSLKNGEVNVESSQFEVSKVSISRTSPVDVLQLKTEVCSVAQSPSEHTLALGCIDGSVLLHSTCASILVKSLFIPYHLVWHPDGSLLLAANEKGQIRCYDLALAPINFQIASETPQSCNFLDLSPYFRGQPHLSNICWNRQSDVSGSNYSATSDGLVFMLFSRGPCVALRVIIGGGLGTGDLSLTPERLVCMYLKSNLVDCAINLLRCLSWENQGQSCIASLHLIIHNLIAKRLTPRSEVQLEAALGIFMSPTVPLSKSVEKKYGHIVHSFARKFFSHILRFNRLELAFRLAIDIGDCDLFLLLHSQAKAVNNLELAKAAVEYADQLTRELNDDSESTSSHCSRSSCSQCGSDGQTETEVKRLSFTAAQKNAKVTFSETVTHIVHSENGAAEEEDDEGAAAASTPLLAPVAKGRRIGQVAGSRSALLPPSPNISGLPVIDPLALKVGPISKQPFYVRGERLHTFQGATYRPPFQTGRPAKDNTSYNPDTDDSALNVHIAWKSVTTLTDPRTRTSITQVSEAFETLLMPQASLDLSEVGGDNFAVAACKQAPKKPSVSEVKSLSTLNKPAGSKAKSDEKNSNNNLPSTSKEVQLNGRQEASGSRVGNAFFRPSRNEIGLPMKNFKAVFSEPVDV